MKIPSFLASLFQPGRERSQRRRPLLLKVIFRQMPFPFPRPTASRGIADSRRHPPFFFFLLPHKKDRAVLFLFVPRTETIYDSSFRGFLLPLRLTSIFPPLQQKVRASGKSRPNATQRRFFDSPPPPLPPEKASASPPPPPPCHRGGRFMECVQLRDVRLSRFSPPPPVKTERSHCCNQSARSDSVSRVAQNLSVFPLFLPGRPPQRPLVIASRVCAPFSLSPFRQVGAFEGPPSSFFLKKPVHVVDQAGLSLFPLGETNHNHEPVFLPSPAGFAARRNPSRRGFSPFPFFPCVE